jgi:Tfp pilus assembly protein PilZ
MAYQEAVQVEEKRKSPRKNCLISVECSIKESVFTNYIYNISNDGVFIETNKAFEEGQQVSLKILAPYNLTKMNRIMGEVVRVELDGIAVRFKKEDPEQEEMISMLVEKL